MLNKEQFAKLTTEPTTLIINEQITLESYHPTAEPNRLVIVVKFTNVYTKSSRTSNSIVIPESFYDTRTDLIEAIRHTIVFYAERIASDIETLFNKSI